MAPPRPAALPTPPLTPHCPLLQPVDGKCKLVAPLVNNSLYESPVDGQVMLVSERGSCALGITDTYPEEMELISGVAYEATLELRHENAQLLAGLKSTPIWLDTPLAKVRSVPTAPVVIRANASVPADRLRSCPCRTRGPSS